MKLAEKEGNMIRSSKDADGKGENIWDVWTRVPGNVIDGSDGTIACDSYNQYYTDIKILEQMGVKSYRFSISWARILPNGINKMLDLGQFECILSC